MLWTNTQLFGPFVRPYSVTNSASDLMPTLLPGHRHHQSSQSSWQLIKTGTEINLWTTDYFTLGTIYSGDQRSLAILITTTCNVLQGMKKISVCLSSANRSNSHNPIVGIGSDTIDYSGSCRGAVIIGQKDRILVLRIKGVFFLG